jgi:ABC-type Fe3+/spermidine/putrescine transport system ATPase subunit
LDAGGAVRVPAADLRGRSGRVAVGVRPEKIRLGADEVNRLDGRVTERAYLGVATQYVVETAHGSMQVYAQNVRSGPEGAGPGENVTLSFSPDAMFVLEPSEEVEQ